MDPSDYEDLQKMVLTMTDVMHELVQEVTNEKDPVRKKREATVEANNTWSDLADENWCLSCQTEGGDLEAMRTVGFGYVRGALCRAHPIQRAPLGLVAVGQMPLGSAGLRRD